jgi:hypothetical protein
MNNDRITRPLLAALLCVAGGAADAAVVMSQVYGGGGNTGAPFKADFVELFNNGTSTESIAGWSIQYASSTGSSWTNLNIPSGSIPAGGYFLVKISPEGPNGAVLPTPDLDSTVITASSSNGKFALVNDQASLSGTCPTGANIADFRWLRICKLLRDCAYACALQFDSSAQEQ